jgi:mono/diheme cytochrome c family protein
MRKFTYAFPIVALLCGGLSLSAQDAAPKGDAEKGKGVFEETCGGCHNADSTEKKMGPGLKGLFAKEKMANGNKPTYENVLKQIDEGGNGMPGYKESLDDQQKKDLLAYLQTL